jgi:hypothetical protein
MLDERIRPHAQVVDTKLDDGEPVLLNLESKTYYSLNPTGERVWRGLKQGLTPREISRQLQAEFEVDEADAERSVVDLVNELCDQGLAIRASRG